MRMMHIIHILKGGRKMNLLKRLFVEEEGQGLVEYALILGLIAVAVVGILGFIGTDINTLFGRIRTGLGITPAQNGG